MYFEKSESTIGFVYSWIIPDPPQALAFAWTLDLNKIVTLSSASTSEEFFGKWLGYVIASYSGCSFAPGIWITF